MGTIFREFCEVQVLEIFCGHKILQRSGLLCIYYCMVTYLWDLFFAILFESQKIKLSTVCSGMLGIRLYALGKLAMPVFFRSNIFVFMVTGSLSIPFTMIGKINGCVLNGTVF